MLSLRVLCVFVVVLSAGAGLAQANFIAYNDVVWASTHRPLVANVTTYNIGNGSPGPASGVLKDFTTGAPTGVTAALVQNGGVNWQPDLVTGGDDCNVGTDARSVFGPTTAGLQGTVYYGSTGWWVDVTFTGANPGLSYEFVTTANRKGAYSTRLTKYTISGADAFINASTAGVTIGDGGASSTFSTGENTAAGYVARWTGITTGADGSFKVRAEGTPSENRGYAFDAFMLVEVPEPATIGLLALGGLAALRRRR